MISRVSTIGAAIINLLASAFWMLCGLFMSIASFNVYQLIQAVS